MKEILYGVAYYYEYMPYERLEEDARMMKECGINMVRICESTWGYHERQDGVFNFDHVDRILEVMHRHGIKVIIGTPTYAIPTWLAKRYPEILADRKDGRARYGSRQNMDISHPTYRYYAERIIRKLIEHTYRNPAVIGFQVDNETKHYHTEGENVQKQFLQHLKTKFSTPEEMNKAFGFHYWSNSVNAWEDMPSTMGSINGSLNSEFSKFQRMLVTDFLAWQVAIVNEYKLPHQFITHNFDLSWRSGSYAIQPDVDHFEASQPLDVAGIDIYHKTQDDLDGMKIALAGDLARSMKQDNYFVIETSAQSILNSASQRLHYPGQLRLQAYSHIASGANMVAYWHWHSIHNSAETYWKGLLSHDLEPNPTYYEAQQIAAEFKKYSKDLISLKKRNRVAIYFSNESLTALREFPFSYSMNYNDIVHQLYDILYRANIECDFADHTVSDFSKYKVIIVPPLYVASDQELEKLIEFARNGGSLLLYFKSGFCDENVQVRTERMPAVLREACGFNYQQFTNFEKLPLKDNPFDVS
ncbi:beta-galactosidase, partial [candidate division KSB1 bacterium]|nr:beta-galactosidase [candidate division KSB1 bacterium]